MTVLSKIQNIFLTNLFNKFQKHPKKYGFSLLFIIITFLVGYLNTSKSKKRLSRLADEAIPKKIMEAMKKPKKSGKGRVNMEFFKNLLVLLKIVLPSWICPETKDLVYLSVALYLRTLLSIYLATIKGKLVKGIINQNFQQFMKGIVQLGLCSIPGSFINSSLAFFNKRLSLNFRKRLNDHFMKKYLSNFIFYKITNLDQRILNPDQNLTADIEKWASSMSTLYSNISKPLLDITLIGQNLSKQLGWGAPLWVIGWYVLCGIFQFFYSPIIGKMTAIQQKLEGQYRYLQSELIKHSEEIAFFDGKDWEKKQILKSYRNFNSQQENINFSRLYMGTMDSLLIKYGASIMGYLLIGTPVFGKDNQKYIQETGKDASKITRDYVRNSNLLIDLASAIGRLINSYKNLQLLAGYTQLVSEMNDTINDISINKFKRNQMNQQQLSMNGKFEDSQRIIFENVPIVTPNGETLVPKLNLEINPGMNILISGPNGCGKSSMFRILGQLWPLYGGVVKKPKINKLFYIPQRPYLPDGTLRDQIIYPHTKEIMKQSGKSDEDVKKLLNDVNISYFLERNDGLDTLQNWNDDLSQGEKQQIAMARLFYHQPDYAILDECTSNTALNMETLFKCKQLNITLFTVSHRQSLYKFHDWVLRFDGEGDYKLMEMKDFTL